VSTAPFPSDGLVLGIESSCDETAVALVRGGRAILSSIVHSQAPEHARFGGVVPEVAGRSHLSALPRALDEAFAAAGCTLDDVDGIAVTNKPGLIGSLLVGVCAAKSLAWQRGLPIVGVDHIEAHVHAATMEFERTDYPCLALVVSGGHTALYVAHSPARLERLCGTLDDAAGEAFDKVAHLLGLGYPGGPTVARLAREGRRDGVAFPRYRAPAAKPAFSFSGLKTAVLYHLRGGDALAPTPAPEDIANRADVAASFEEAVVDALVAPTLATAERLGLATILVAGGVACNLRLREVLTARARDRGREARFPSPAYCTDNAAMIAGLGHALLCAGVRAGLDLDASPRS
jgi:N6-L-threonylcarbamoyladenine synthase